MAAYLLKDGHGEFASHDVYDAWQGFQESGEEVRPFTEGMLQHGVLYNRREDVVVGWVRTVSAALEQIGCAVPGTIDYPAALAPWLHRQVRRATLRDAQAMNSPAFIKPAGQVKLFDGAVVAPGDNSIISKHPPDTAIWISDVVTWRCEWRVYVHAHAIIGAYPYRGDWRLPVSWGEVERMAALWRDSPIGYALDIGILHDGRTALIEANDAWALGNYGLLPKDYSNLLRSRWDEMTAGT